MLDLLRTGVTRHRRLALAYHDIDGDTFARHASFLAQAFEFRDIDSFLTRTDTARELPVATLTFDDGYRTFFTDVVPILKHNRIPATWFVPTALVGTDDVFWFSHLRCAVAHTRRTEIEVGGRLLKIRPWDVGTVTATLSRAVKSAPAAHKDGLLGDLLDRLGEPPPSSLEPFRIVSPAQLAALAADPLTRDLVTIGSHSHTHPQMSQLDDASLERELRFSKELLEGWTGRRVEHFAFPSGDHDDRIVSATARAGYLSSWTTEAKFHRDDADRYRMPRVSADTASIGILSAKITLAGLRDETMQHSGTDRKTVVKDHFNSFATDNRWGELYNPSNPVSHSFLARRAKAVEMLGDFQGGRLLDIGCGTGALMAAVAPLVDYHAIDNAPNMVEQTKLQASALGIADRCHVQTGDATALPFESNYFDRVVGLGLLEYFDTPERVVAEAVRVTKPGGRLVFNVPLRFNVDRLMVWLSAPLRAAARRATGKKADAVEHGTYTREAFRALFTRVGCRVVDERVYNKQIVPYPVSRVIPRAAGRAAALVENRDGFDMFATGCLLACEKTVG